MSVKCKVCDKVCSYRVMDYIPEYAALEEIAAEQSASILRMHEDYAALLARHNALREAVAWERDCCQDIRPRLAWFGLYLRHGEDYVDGVAEDLRAIQDAARAEVDRMLSEGK